MFLKLNKNKLSCFNVYNCLLIKYFKPGSAEYFFFKLLHLFFQVNEVSGVVRGGLNNLLGRGERLEAEFVR